MRSASPRSARKAWSDEGGRRVGARVVVVTHTATDAALSETVDALADFDVVQSVASVLRLEGTSV